MDEEFRNNVQEVETEEYTPHYPPRTLREIYSLPHKNRGDLKDGLTVSNKEIAEVMNVVHTNELAPEELEKLLTEGATANMSDVRDGRVSERQMEFLDAIGWTSKAEDLERVFSVNDTLPSGTGEERVNSTP